MVDDTTATSSAEPGVLSRAELEAENSALRARVAELNDQVAALAGKVADLEKLLGRNS